MRVPLWRTLGAGVATAVMAALLAGCGGDGKGEASATTTSELTTPVTAKPCELITEAEVEAAVGEPVTKGGGAGLGQAGSCAFSLGSNTSTQVLIIKTQSNVPTYNKLKAAAEQPQDLSGVGDRAYVAGPQAVVMKGNSLYVVTLLIDWPRDKLADAATKLADALVS